MRATWKKVYPPFDPAAEEKRKLEAFLTSPIPRLADIPPFFLQSTFPQYRKRVMVDGQEVEMKLDGTETKETHIVEYSESEQYMKWRVAALKESQE